MLRTILENHRVILEALRDGTDTEWITSEINKRIEATSEEISKLHQPTVSVQFCEIGITEHNKSIFNLGQCHKCYGNKVI